MIAWTKQEENRCPAGWVAKEERATVGRFCLSVSTWESPTGMVWNGRLSGVCQTGDYDTAEKAKAALLKLAAMNHVIIAKAESGRITRAASGGLRVRARWRTRGSAMNPGTPDRVLCFRA